MKRNRFTEIANVTFVLALFAAAWPLVIAAQIAVPPLPPSPTNVVEFSPADYLVSETNGTVAIVVRRRGDLQSVVTVSYRTIDGTARAGHNYKRATGTLRFVQGDAEKAFTVGILNDPETEPNESFHILLNQASGGAVVGTVAKATVTIFDVSAPLTLPPVIGLLSPTNGQTFRARSDISVVATAQDKDGVVKMVEFFANGKSLGVTTNNPASASPVDLFQTKFSKAPPGRYVLTAKATDDLGATTLSQPILIRVFEDAVPNVVTIAATDATASELDSKDVGKFTVHRTGNRQAKLNVRYSIGGSAANGVDYEKLSGLVTIPAGATSASVKVNVIPDKAIEGDETVTLKLEQLVFVVQPPLEDDYTVGDPNGAMVTITEKEAPNFPPKVDITTPRNGATFDAPASIKIKAETADVDGTVEQVAFFVDGELLGLDTKAPFDLTWHNVKAGHYTLVAEAKDNRGAMTKSVPVEIKVIEPSATPTVTIVAADASVEEATLKRTGQFKVSRTGNLRTKLSVQYSISGTAENGVDYEKLSGVVTIPAGAESANITVVPVPDQKTEGNETVIVTLNQLFYFVKPAPEDDYFVGSPKSATVTILDGPVVNPIPAIQITSPKDNATFSAGSDILISAQITGTTEPVKQVSFSTGDKFLAVVTAPPYSFVWRNVPAGAYKLIASTIVEGDMAIASPPVVVHVQGAPAVPFVKRRLPSGYVPGQKLQVILQTGPDGSTVSHAVEDEPPAGWSVSGLSDGGVFDAVRGRVKFGPFFDSKPRALTYEVTPPVNESGAKKFKGSASSDGVETPIVGDETLGTSSLHPADTDPDDHRITLAELTAYSAAWKKNATWPVGPNPIPLSYVTRAGELWQNGEDYIFDPQAGPAPLWWVSKNGPRTQSLTTSTSRISPDAVAGGSVKRFVSSEAGTPGVIAVELGFSVSPAITAYAVEERVAEGWTVADMTEDGVFDESSRTIRWGVFYDGGSRNLSYRLVATHPATSAPIFWGQAAFDGHEVGVASGSQSDNAEMEADRFNGDSSSELLVSLRAETGRRYLVQASADLVHWSDLGEFVAKDGAVAVRDAAANHMSQCFYRMLLLD